MVKIQEGVLGTHPDVGPGKYPLCSSAEAMSHFQQQKSNRGELSAINREVGGWIKHTHTKKKFMKKKLR